MATDCLNWGPCQEGCFDPPDFMVTVDTLYFTTTVLSGGAVRYNFGYSVLRVCCEDVIGVSFFDESSPNANPITLNGWAIGTVELTNDSGIFQVIDLGQGTPPPPIKFTACNKTRIIRLPLQGDCDCAPNALIPDNVTAQVVSPNSVQVSWDAVVCEEAATEYWLQYRLQGEAQWQAVGTLLATNYTVANLPVIGIYEFRVSAVCGTCAGTPSAEVVAEISVPCEQFYALQPSPLNVELSAEVLTATVQINPAGLQQPVPDYCCDFLVITNVSVDHPGITAELSTGGNQGTVQLNPFDAPDVIITSDGSAPEGSYTLTISFDDCEFNNVPPVTVTVDVTSIPCYDPQIPGVSVPEGHAIIGVQIDSAGPGGSFEPVFVPTGTPFTCDPGPYSVDYDSLGSVQAMLEFFVSQFGTALTVVSGNTGLALIPEQLLVDAFGSCDGFRMELCTEGAIEVSPIVDCNPCVTCASGLVGTPNDGFEWVGMQIEITAVGEGESFVLAPTFADCAASELFFEPYTAVQYGPSTPTSISSWIQNNISYFNEQVSPNSSVAFVSYGGGGIINYYVRSDFYTHNCAEGDPAPWVICGLTGDFAASFTVLPTCNNCGWTIAKPQQCAIQTYEDHYTAGVRFTGGGIGNELPFTGGVELIANIYGPSPIADPALTCGTSGYPVLSTTDALDNIHLAQLWAYLHAFASGGFRPVVLNWDDDVHTDGVLLLNASTALITGAGVTPSCDNRPRVQLCETDLDVFVNERDNPNNGEGVLLCPDTDFCGALPASQITPGILLSAELRYIGIDGGVEFSSNPGDPGYIGGLNGESDNARAGTQHVFTCHKHVAYYGVDTADWYVTGWMYEPTDLQIFDDATNNLLDTLTNATGPLFIRGAAYGTGTTRIRIEIEGGGGVPGYFAGMSYYITGATNAELELFPRILINDPAALRANHQPFLTPGGFVAAETMCFAVNTPGGPNTTANLNGSSAFGGHRVVITTINDGLGNAPRTFSLSAGSSFSDTMPIGSAEFVLVSVFRYNTSNAQEGLTLDITGSP